MIGLDTNVLVRFLVEDDPGQTAAVRRRIEQAIANDEQLFVSDIVLCELCWVLNVSYDLPRVKIAAKLRELTHAKHLTFASSEHVVRALDAFETGAGDFSDYLIREHARAHECETVLTFDRALWRDPDFVAP